MPPLPHEGGRVVFAAPLRVEAELTNARLGILVRGEVTGEATLTCDRCLAPFRWPVRFSFLEEYRFEGGGGDEARRLEGDEVELDGPVREQLLLSLPFKKLCRPDCRGLCPLCGQNLNEGDCGCRRESGDPRLAELARLLGGDEG